MFRIIFNYTSDYFQLFGVKFSGFYQNNWFNDKLCRFVGFLNVYVLRQMVIAIKKEAVAVFKQNRRHNQIPFTPS